jgi:hypothetical protein
LACFLDQCSDISEVFGFIHMVSIISCLI